MARKEAIQNPVLSPESPGEDPYIPDRERVKSSSSAGSRRRSNSRGSPRRVKEVRSDSAKRKTPEALGVCRPYGGRTEGAKKRSKKNSPGRQDQEQSRRYNEDWRYPTSAGRSPVPNPSRPQAGTSNYPSNLERSSYSSKTEARSKECEAPSD